jgi:hypothetical protein
MRLLARALSRGRLSMVEAGAAADLVIAEAATDLARRSWLAPVGAISAARLPEAEPMEDPSPLSAYLDGRRLCRGRRERRTLDDCSYATTPSMMGPYASVTPTV